MLDNTNIFFSFSFGFSRDSYIVMRRVKKKLNGGIGIYPRQLPVVLVDKTRKSERIEFLKRQIGFEITIRYRL